MNVRLPGPARRPAGRGPVARRRWARPGILLEAPVALLLGVPAALLLGGCAGEDAAAGDGSTPSAETLRPPSEFEDIAEDGERAHALFAEMGKVLRHPRCVNCHPSGEEPLQGDDSRPHEPKVVRGAGGLGPPGMECTTCHQRENVRLEADWAMPGHPSWHLAPASMAWAGVSLAEICAQIKDPARNGGLGLEQLVTHLAEDDLVGWGWRPGAGRERAPGTQEEFGELARAWVDAGAGCPSEG